MVLCLGEPPRRFLLFFISFLYLHFIFDLHFIFVYSFSWCSSFVVVLHSLCFSYIIPHPSVDYRRVFTPILYFQPSPSQSDLRHFHFQPFRYLLTTTATVLSERFLPYAPSPTFWLHLRLSRPPWEPAVLPWSLQGFILIFDTQTQLICLFESK